MNRTNKIWHLIPLLFFGICLNYKLINDADNQTISDGLIEVALFIGLILSLLLASYRDYKSYVRVKLKLNFLPTFLGIFLILLCITINYFLEARDNSPILIRAINKDDLGGLNFELREDSTYKFESISILGSSVFRGTYAIQGGKIILDKSNVGDILKSKNLIFCYDSIDSNANATIFEVNDKQDIIDEYNGLKVIEDHRKK